MVKLACQTIVFGNPVIKDTMEQIVETISSIGYDGAEVGIRHFYLERVDAYKELFTRHGLQLPAVHMGGDFLDADSVKSQLENYRQTLDFAQKMGCEYIYLSGAHQKGKAVEDYRRESAIYNEMGRQCREMGMKLCYHNHDWEIVNQLAGMRILLEETDPQYFRLVPDVGWLTVANADPVRFLGEHLDRIEALHFKDFRPIWEFTELGTGIVDFPAVYAFFTGTHADFWISAEQDETRKAPAESARENFLYIDALRKGGI